MYSRSGKMKKWPVLYTHLHSEKPFFQLALLRFFALAFLVWFPPWDGEEKPSEDGSISKRGIVYLSVWRRTVLP